MNTSANTQRFQIIRIPTQSNPQWLIAQNWCADRKLNIVVEHENGDIITWVEVEIKAYFEHCRILTDALSKGARLINHYIEGNPKWRRDFGQL